MAANQQLSKEDLKNIEEGAKKASKLLKMYSSHKEYDENKLKRDEGKIKEWMLTTLIEYALEDTQVKYCKGLQYICLGIAVSLPEFQPTKCKQIFRHYMFTLKLRQLFLEGSPRFY